MDRFAELELPTPLDPNKHLKGVDRMKSRTTTLGATVLAMTFLNAPLLAYAAGPYVGASVGQAWVDASAGEIEAAFATDDGFVASGTTIDDSDMGWKAFVGYRFNPFFALEGGYVDLG